MTAISQTITALANRPDIADPGAFESKTNSLINDDLPALITEINTWASQANTLKLAINAAISGGAFAIDYVFSTTTTAADPGAGFMRLNSATQNSATAMYLDLTDSNGTDYTSALDLFDDSTSTIKGFLMLRNASDGTKYLLFALTAVASPSGYRAATVTCVASSATNPFANGEEVTLAFARTGDKGDTGATGTFGGTASSTADMLTGANIASASTVNLDTATGNRVHITGTTSITAVTLTRGPRTVIFDGALTLTHHATNNNLPGAANITTAAGDRAIYESDGTTVYCVGYFRKDGLPVAGAAAGDHCVAVHSGSGHGIVNTCIRCFSTVLTNVGTAITYAFTAGDGPSFTITQAGMYEVTSRDTKNSTACYFGISVNATALTTSITSLSAAAGNVALTRTSSGSSPTQITRVLKLAAGDVVRPHTDGSPDSTDFNSAFFSIRKIGS